MTTLIASVKNVSVRTNVPAEMNVPVPTAPHKRRSKGNSMTIKLTETAAEEVKKSMEEMEGQYLRVGVKGGGCSGFEYSLGIDDEYDEKQDTISSQHGVAVVVDRKSDLYLDGTTLDYYTDLSKRGFVFENPNAVKSCGCGSSFQV